MKLICFGARKNEQPFFNNLNKPYGYDLTLVEDLLTNKNIDLVKGHEAVLLRGNCLAKDDNLKRMKELGVKYLLTRTVGYDHIDVEEAKKLGFVLARVPGYSPNAIAELGLSLTLMLVRHTAEMVEKSSQGDFKVYPSFFSKEIRNMKVGVLGVGKIGLTTAKLFKGIGATVLGYDPFPSEEAKSEILMTSLENLRNEADVIVLHMPFIKDKNYHLVNEDFIKGMKQGSFLINMARGEIVDLEAVIKAIENNHLEGFGTDVLENESMIFNKNFEKGKTNNPTFDKLISLYPKALITPHVGSNTDEACSNMIEQSYENLKKLINKEDCKNIL